MEFNPEWENLLDIEVTNKGNIKKEIEWIVQKLKRNMKLYGEAYPAPSTKDGKYPIIENREWTTSFWTGMLWIAYEFSKDNEFLELAKTNTESFINRLETQYEIDHHDIGFLYTLSTVAAYKVCGEKKYFDASVKAADLLCERFNEDGGFIQAWGPKFAKDENRAIIDSLLNIPLLFWASAETGNSKYKDIAITHYQKVIKNIIREDNTTYHTYYFDNATGEPLYGKTRQGFSDNSCWARGQAWAVYGQALANKYTSDEMTVEKFDTVLDYYIAHLPKDSVAYWDLIFTDDNPSDRDTSSNAIVLCGLLERAKQTEDNEDYLKAIKIILSGLQQGYTTINDDENEGILTEGVYSWHTGRGVCESNIWGDYFYLEALYRIYANRWPSYW